MLAANGPGAPRHRLSLEVADERVQRGKVASGGLLGPGRGEMQRRMSCVDFSVRRVRGWSEPIPSLLAAQWSVFGRTSDQPTRPRSHEFAQVLSS